MFADLLFWHRGLFLFVPLVFLTLKEVDFMDSGPYHSRLQVINTKHLDFPMVPELRC